MNTEDNIPYLDDLLDQFENGELPLDSTAYKCYKDQLDRHMNRITWVHSGELKNHSLLRKLSIGNQRDVKFKTRPKKKI